MLRFIYSTGYKYKWVYKCLKHDFQFYSACLNYFTIDFLINKIKFPAEEKE